MIELADKPGVFLAVPEEPALAKLWALACSKVEAGMGRAPATAADWRAVTDEYHRLAAKPTGALGEVLVRLVREHCGEVANDGD